MGILVMFLALSHHDTPIQCASMSTLHSVLGKGVRKISLPILISVKTKESGPEYEGCLIQACCSPLLSSQSLQRMYFVLSSTAKRHKPYTLVWRVVFCAWIEHGCVVYLCRGIELHTVTPPTWAKHQGNSMAACPYLQGCSCDTSVKGSNYLASQSHAVHMHVQRFQIQKTSIKVQKYEKKTQS